MTVSGKKLIVALKAIAGVLILIWIWPNGFLDRLDDILQQAAPAWILLVIVVSSLQFVLAAARWHRISAVMGVDVPFLHFLRYVYVSAFIALVLPTSVGADAVRLWYTKSQTVSWIQGLRTILIDRAFSLLALMVIVAVGVSQRLSLLSHVPEWVLVESLIVCFFSVFALLVLFSPRLPRFEKVPGAVFIFSLLRDFRLCLSAGIGRDGGIIALSMVSQAVVIISLGFLFYASGQEFDPWALFALLPLVILVSSLPISIGGWGVREVSLVSIAPVIGTTEEVAFAVSLAYGLLSILVSLPGAFLWPGARRYEENRQMGANHL